MHTLIVEHMLDSEPPAFTVVRLDPHQITPEPAVVTPPEDFEANGLAKGELRRELRWYLEHFLVYPFSPNTERADKVLGALKEWGSHAFSALFGSGKGRDFFHDAVRDGVEQLEIRIISNAPVVLAWPWEALHDPEGGYLAQHCSIERQLNNVPDPPALPENLPRDRVNILLVTARPFEGDVQYRSISRAVVELIENKHLAAKVTVLRPPTYDALCEELDQRKGYYHIVHFDGHGGYGVIADEPSKAATLVEAVDNHKYQGPQGCLVFETTDGKPDPISAEVLSSTLSEFRIPMVVLNACQSATIDERAENAFASVAASLIRGGIRSVVAMAYSLYVSGAQCFLPAFYKRLLESGSLAEPARAGRQAMLAHAGRVCARGTYPLHDWLVPVVYQQQPMDFSFVAKGKVKESAKEQEQEKLPEEAQDRENPFGFIGRDGAVLAMERALLRDAPAILITGLGGVGKTTLASGFVRWLSQTEGLGAGCFWMAFNDIHSAEYVLNQMGSAIFGSKFITLDSEQKITALGKVMKENRFIIVWDNFESASGNEAAGIDPLLKAEDLQLLRSFLAAIRGGKSKVLITSRSEETWLTTDLRYKLPLGGLIGEERWEFCTAILRNLGLKVDRDDPDLAELMDLLDGHPLLMRAVLPRLEGGISARTIIDELHGNLAQLDAGEDKTQEKVNATLRFIEDGLPAELRPLLVPLALHEKFADINMIEEMAKQVEEVKVSRAQIGRLMAALATAGLVRDWLQGVIYELHPALTGFLNSTVLKNSEKSIVESWTRAFVDIMGRLADAYAPRELHEQRGIFHIYSANFHAALGHAERLDMDDYFAALTQSLAVYAQNTWNLDGAQRLFARLAEQRQRRGDEEGEADAYHQLGRITEERRDFENAEKWYLKALKIDERLGNESGAAMTYHQLGMIALKRWDFEGAEKWYLKSLEIKERLGNESGAATTYHQLGMIAEERRDFDGAEKWYLKSLEITERLGNESYAASTYGELGNMAQERRDFETAEKWYLKVIEIDERLGKESEAAVAYHQLGINAQKQRDFETAEKWYLKSLEIKEKLCNESGAASSYHQLGTVTEERRDLEGAEKWYLKSLEIKERLGNESGAAITYHQLGRIAQERRDFEGAEKWYLKSLEIKERLGNEFSAAMIYGQMGIIAGFQGKFIESGQWLIKSIRTFANCNDPHEVKRNIHNFMIFFKNASEAEKAELMKMWREAGLGELPEEKGE